MLRLYIALSDMTRPCGSTLARHDMRAELREHYETADRARAYDMFHDRQSSKINGVTSTEGWTDEELVGYAMIMSLEETGLPPPTPPDQAGCWEEASLAAAKSKGKARTPSSLSARGSVSSFSPKIGPSGGVSVSPRMAPTSPMFQPASRSSPKLDAAMSSSPRGTREQWAMLGAAALSSSPGGSASSFNKSNSKVSFTTVQEQQQLQKMSETSQYRKLMSADSWEDDTEDDSDPDFEVDHSVRAKGQRGKKNKKKASTSSLQLDDEDEELQFALQLSLRDM
ncbi:hypothetical protein M427DRAFT_406927 [Gonapodya prolifera JEL478]|uniref:Uncharacterized protein n=1 Tax=Gonapodya prolifera (strain JEL478) TaxID=1344416 RepID=A0A139AU90_GONPJ|nr:hypothetical protein M427DRAFT_406927 [Gonapodya prolifera JEL478]|eukprot:KXS20302.1 hypothetical protein M427DRAFT_406927 [Gonapodya prolifera JEL478]